MKIPTLDVMMQDTEDSPKADWGKLGKDWQEDGMIYNGHGEPIGVMDYNMSESKEILTDGHGNPIGYRF